MEAQQGRRAARGKAREIILPGSVPTPLRESDHSALWKAVRGVEAKVNYILGILAVLLPLTLAVLAAVVLK